MKTLVATVILVSTAALSHAAHADHDRPTTPRVPVEIQVPAGHKAFLSAHAIGTQGYVCTAVGTTFKWTTFGPQATLFNEDQEQVLTHFLSATPYSLVLNPAWQHSRDTSIVWGQMIKSSTDPKFVAPGAIPWLLLQAVAVGDGPTGGDRMTATRYIQRVNTVEGAAPTTGCTLTTDIGKRALVSYEADYVFYKEKGRNGIDVD